ncbi:MAG: glycosyltransferase [Proteobacteria bacterium]|nr:glycosyltransferase [Pseudomonadota bacterium]
MSRPTLSVCLIVKDEADNLPRSLGGIVRHVDEVVVVDTGSTDGTPEMAEALGAAVTHVTWTDDFAAARNESIARATGDWILWLDADNRVPDEHAARLRGVLPDSLEVVVWMTEVLEPSGHRLRQKRIFPRRPDVGFTGRIHEQLRHPPGFENVFTDLEVIHWGYADKAQARAKAERNLRLVFEELDRTPDDFYLLYQAGKTLLGLNRSGEAESFLRKIVAGALGRAQNPELYFHAHLLLERALSLSGQGAEADRVLAALANLAPEFGPGRLACGRRLLQAGRHDEAINHLTAAIDHGPTGGVIEINPSKDAALARYTRARCYLATGRPEEAARDLEAALGLEPDNAHFWYELGRARIRCGRVEAARQSWRRCLTIQPRHRGATRALSLGEAAHG